jgi:hypothetical protein
LIGGLIIEHKVISESDKKREEELYSSFHEMRPGLLGYICDTLVKVLEWKKENPKGLQLPKYPRLADFAEICEIISRCIGNPDMAFIEAYNRNINSRHRRIVNDSAVGRAIEIFVENKPEWIGDMAYLLLELRNIASADLKLVSVKNSKYWPQTPGVLSRKINEIKDSLRAIGIEIDRFSGDTSERTYVIGIITIQCHMIERED